MSGFSYKKPGDFIAQVSANIFACTNAQCIDAVFELTMNQEGCLDAQQEQKVTVQLSLLPMEVNTRKGEAA